MKLKISLIILLFLLIFILSCRKEFFQNNLINMPKGFIAIKGNFFSQGAYPTGPSSVVLDADTVAEKYGKFSEISLDKKNMIVKQGYHVRNQLCLDNFCIDGNDLSKFDDDKKVPRFYKKCENYKIPDIENDSASEQTTQPTGTTIATNFLDWKDSRNRTCEDYKNNPEKCINAESFTPTSGDFKGISAKDACCVCKSSNKKINNVNYEEIIYNHNNKNNIPDLLCSRARSGYRIVVNGANQFNIHGDPTNINVNGTYISNGTYNNATLFKKDGTSNEYQIKYKTFNNDAFKGSLWTICYQNIPLFILKMHQSNLKWIQDAPGIQILDFNGIEKNNDDNELCISGQELRILNGSKSINIKSDWDSQNDYIRPYNTQYGDGNNNSGLRDYIFYQKDNDVMGIAEDKTKALTKGKDNIQPIETCDKHVSSKPNCLTGTIRYENINDPRAQIVYEDKWIIRYGGSNIYYNNSSDTNNVPESEWKYNKKSFGNWGDGRHYRGTQNRARNGRRCQRWTSQRPNGHSRTPQNYPNFGLGNHNYCRNPDGEPDIWCYTMPGRWDFCDANTIQVRRGSVYRPPGGTGETDLKQASITGHTIGDGKNINGNYREVKIEGHYCKDSGKSATGADYGIEYIILPGKKDNNSLSSINNYTHIHDHSHNNSPHLAI